MRIHGSYKNVNYWKLFFSEAPDVLCDGELLTHVIEADDVAGYALVEIWEKSGDHWRPQRAGDVIATRRMCGKIQLRGALHPWAVKA